MIPDNDTSVSSHSTVPSKSPELLSVVSSRSRGFLMHFTDSHFSLYFLFDFLVSGHCDIPSAVVPSYRALVYCLLMSQCHSLEPGRCWHHCHILSKHLYLLWTPSSKPRDEMWQTFPPYFLPTWPKPLPDVNCLAKQHPSVLKSIPPTDPTREESQFIIPAPTFLWLWVPWFAPYFLAPSIRPPSLISWFLKYFCEP